MTRKTKVVTRDYGLLGTVGFKRNSKDRVDSSLGWRRSRESGEGERIGEEGSWRKKGEAGWNLGTRYSQAGELLQRQGPSYHVAGWRHGGKN